MKTKPYAEALAEALDALDQYYNHPTDMTDYEYLDFAGQERLRLDRHAQVTRAQTAVDAALAAGMPVRQLAVASHLAAGLIITLASDPAERREAYIAEIAHLQRAIQHVEAQRGRDIAGRWQEGETKPALAVEFGVTRPTLDEWIKRGAADPASVDYPRSRLGWP